MQVLTEEIQVKRRTVLAIPAGAAAVAGLSACGSDSGSSSTEVKVTLSNHPWTEAIKKVIPDFEKETGLKVTITQLGEDQLSDQYNVKLNSGTSDIDVLMYRPLQEGKLFARNGWLADLSENVKSGDFDHADYQPGPVEATSYEGKVVGVPLTTERECLYYRKDVLAKIGASAPPNTMDELYDMAKKAKEQAGMAGFVARTGKSAAVTQFSSYLYSYGGDFHSEDGKTATVNTPEAKAAYEMYSKLIRETGPANVSTDMSWPEAMAIFTQGNAAFYTEADVLYPNATDASKSKVADNVGFAPFPQGPAGRKPFNIPSWGLAVNAKSENKDNAWKFIAWACSKAKTLELQKGGIMSARQSAWSDAAGTAGFPKDLAAAINENAKAGVGHDRPLVIQVAKAREIVGQPIVDGITGKDLAGAIDKAQADFQKFLEDEAK
ncbi:ABC transporter substrate-binding protein [Propionibacteriaceae bacterium G57]|uniref:ABC transporter substrate-binding protein n=1 Tax=Aestuariimicrobium sp. G57 TaxID=3418485 RepID=UPI003DA6D46B